MEDYSSTLSKLRGVVDSTTQSVSEHLSRVAEAQKQATNAAGSGQSAQVFLREAQRVAKEAITYAKTGNSEEASKRRQWLETNLAIPEMRKSLSSIAGAQIQGISQAAEYFASGAWTSELVQAQKDGAPLTHASFISKYGPDIGPLAWKKSQGTLTSTDAVMLQQMEAASASGRTPITGTDPDTGEPVVRGYAPDIAGGVEAVNQASGVMAGWGFNPGADGSRFSSTLPQIVPTIKSLGGLARAGMLPDLVDKVNTMTTRWAGGKAAPEEKSGSFSSVQSVAQKLSAYASANPDNKYLVAEYFERIVSDPELSRDDFLQKAVGGADTYIKHKKALDKVRKYRDEMLAIGAGDQTALPDVWRDVNPKDLVDYSLHGDRDPTKDSGIDSQLALAKSLETRDAKIKELSNGYTGRLNKDGTREVAHAYEQVIARAYEAVIPAIETARAMGRPELIPHILANGEKKIKDALRNEGYSAEAIDALSKDGGIQELSATVLDVRAVGAGKKPALEEPDLTDLRSAFMDRIGGTTVGASEGGGAPGRPSDALASKQAVKQKTFAERESWLYKDLPASETILAKIEADLGRPGLSPVDKQRLSVARDRVRTAAALEKIPVPKDDNNSLSQWEIKHFKNLSPQEQDKYLQGLQNARDVVVGRARDFLQSSAVHGKVSYAPGDGYLDAITSFGTSRGSFKDNLSGILHGIPVDDLTMNALVDGLRGAPVDVATKVVSDVIESQMKIGRMELGGWRDSVFAGLGPDSPQFHALRRRVPLPPPRSLIGLLQSPEESPDMGAAPDTSDVGPAPEAPVSTRGLVSGPLQSLAVLLRASAGEPRAKETVNDIARAIDRTRQVWSLESALLEVSKADPVAAKRLASRIPGLSVNVDTLLGKAAQAAQESKSPSDMARIAGDITGAAEKRADREVKLAEMARKNQEFKEEQARKDRDAMLKVIEAYRRAETGDTQAVAAGEALRKFMREKYGEELPPFESASTNAPTASANSKGKPGAGGKVAPADVEDAVQRYREENG